ncbi:MAG: TetR/AcrR family transcriptional regulator, transcriptional repressor of bet s [Gammaproteobacteria bacterium]|jgi:TetR/AcrR family transcriptional repressor of bet genes|nr:TetR/AcrR family transcriptional regulator, transcriptional repressor of bet s [Gammaproteobacteria bacterium]
MAKKKANKSVSVAAANVPERASRARQRQRLIDACISALHIHGPSRTTVEKVVALADMSPGIVRFYFDSKDAMLVASLAYLASEFEERVMVPVSLLKDTPVKALEQLVELYLDPEIASPRKVSVWYSFWGEASSRQEYLDLCGKKDEDFAALVHDLIEGVIAETGQTHLDADGVALGLIGVLEVLWQGIAFTNEVEIDRDAAKRRSFAYLRSVFPGQFAAAVPRGSLTTAGAGAQVTPANVPAWAYSNNALLALERDRLFRPSWQLVGHEADIPQVGDYLTADLAGERVLVLRSSQTRIVAFRNSCRKRPHALLMDRSGHLAGTIECPAHELVYGFDGKLRSGSTPGDLTPLELALPGKFILVRALAGKNADPASPALLEIAGAPSGDWESLPDLKPAGTADIAVAADWKLMVEQWLEALPRPKGIRRTFLAPNQLLEESATEALVLQVVPESPGRCRIRRLDYSVATAARKRLQQQRDTNTPAPARPPAWLQQDIEVAESMQAGLAAGIDATENAGPTSTQLDEFRSSIAILLPLARGVK